MAATRRSVRARSAHWRYPVGLILAVVLVACGGGGDGPPTAAEDKDRARRIVLTAADLPDLTDMEEGEDGDDDFFATCLNDKALLENLGKGPRGARSSFGNEDGSIARASAVNLAESEEEAEAAFDELTKPGFEGCFETTMRTAFEELGVTSLSVSELPGEEEADESVGYRTTIDVEAGGRALNLGSDYLFLRVGRVVAVVFSLDLDTALDDAERTRLAELLIERMKDA